MKSEVTRLFDILDRYKNASLDNNVAFAHKVDNQWITYSGEDYIEYSNNVSYGLLKLGVQPGDKIGIVSGNRPEWNFLDMGIMQIGAIPIPIYPTISQEEYNFILNHAEIKFLFIEGKELRKKIEPILPNMQYLQEVFTFVDQKGSYRFFQNLVDLGKENPQPEVLAERKAAIKSNDMATIVYTSGTTGNPKGVMLSHSNILGNVDGVTDIIWDYCPRALSFLPLCHMYERMLMYAYQYRGTSIYYSNIGLIADNMRYAEPSIMCCVPRVLEKIYDKLFTAGKKLPYAKRKLYYWAVNVAAQYKPIPEERSWCYNLRYKIADKLIFSQWRDALGANKLRQVVSGGSALQPRLSAFFQAIGLVIYEGYGLTETSPVISVPNREPYTHEIGTVGPALKGIEVKVLDSGELVCRGHNVMLGYYRDDEKTKETIDAEGWFHTGDTAIITDKNLIKITGRIKSLFKTSFGKYVNPEIIEAKFANSPFINTIIVLGENRQYAVALILPEFSTLRTWCSSHGVEYKSDEEVIKQPKVVERFNREIKEYNANFADYEQVKRFKLLADEWSPQNGLLSPTLKVKRKKVQERYTELIENLFV